MLLKVVRDTTATRWTTGIEATLLAVSFVEGPGQDARVVPVLVAIVLGAMGGAVVGLIVARLTRYAIYLAGRHFQGDFLVLIGALLGAIGLVWYVVSHGKF